MRRWCELLAIVGFALLAGAPSFASPPDFGDAIFLIDNSTTECPPGKHVNATQLGLKCVHGHLYCFPPSNTSSTYSLGCACEEGWGGVECDRCNTSNACGVDTPCDHHAIPVHKKFFQCDLTGDFWKTALGDGVASFEEDFDNKSAILNVWSKPTGPPMFFSCNVTECSFAVDQGRDGTRFDYYCLKTSCWCPRDPITGHCYSEPIENATRYLKTTALFSCDTDENPNCYLQQHELGIQIDMKCYIGECAKPPKWEPNIFWPIFELVTVFMIFLIVSLAPALVYRFYQRAPRTLYHVAPTVGAHLRWDRLCYNLLVNTNKMGFFPPLKKRRILRKVYGEVKPGELCCILGASGAGKTTLLDVLAGFEKEGTLTGEITIDGAPFPKNYRKIIGFVPQNDALLPTLTVEEQLMYNAELRLPAELSLEYKRSLVEEVMADLGILHLRNQQIGDDATRGISGGEKRRVSIATELVTHPRVLFLDEPTSGLDSYNALSIMKKLKRMAHTQKQTIICSIHQPRSMIFSMFDRVILLWQGRVVYSGTREQIVPFFHANGYDAGSIVSADWLSTLIFLWFVLAVTAVVDVLAMENDEAVLEMTKIARTQFKLTHASPRGAVLEEETSSSMDPRDIDRVLEIPTPESSLSWFYELAILTHRAFINLWRNPVLLKTHGIASIIVSLFLGIAYFAVSNSVGGLQNRIGSLFFLITIFSFSSMSALDLFIRERPIFLRERANGCYRTSTYFLSKLLTDLIPLRVLLPAMFATVVYWMVGYATGLDHFVKYLIVIVEVNFVSAALLICVSCLTNSLAAATFSSSLLILVMLLFGGFLLNFGTIPVYFVWIRYLSYFSFANEALLGNELHNLPVNIDVSDIKGVTVRTWFYSLGMLAKLTFVAGDLFLDAFKLNPNDYWTNVVALLAQGIVYLVVAALLLRYYVRWRQ